MKKIEYVCDICHKTINKNDIFALLYESYGAKFTLLKPYDLRFEDTHTHICEMCTKQIVSAYKEFNNK